MDAITRIARRDATFNLRVGCRRVSTACDRCYAAALSWRYGRGRDLWDVGADRKRTSPVYWRGPLRRNERGGRKHAITRLLCEYRQRLRQQSADMMARRSAVAHPLDAGARLVVANENTAEHPRHAADRLERGLAARLPWHHDQKPREGQSPHPLLAASRLRSDSAASSLY